MSIGFRWQHVPRRKVLEQPKQVIDLEGKEHEVSAVVQMDGALGIHDVMSCLGADV